MSELKQNETDVCCECGSTNLDYEELHAEVPDKKGYARLEQEVCYCCDCFAIQSEDAQSAEIERLTAKVAKLEKDNARMREALRWREYPKEKPEKYQSCIVINKQGAIYNTLFFKEIFDGNEVRFWLPFEEIKPLKGKE